ncbi:hypothetical protein [Dysgonomonas sp. 25]|uniref:hypothetical protein n=1 Tax=Dysgonomonas sp. 25 TaxID=2302933 RepID=UPI0013CFF02A|nr:hypothetical protein [Dysgonomonas sp. 25]NDV70448.1 hypothetical protein [Dysgonomonas sp. 25]
MGFNIAGIIIGKKYTDIAHLSEAIGFDLELDYEISFDEAIENWKEEGLFDVYFGEKGTAIFTHVSKALDPCKIQEAETLTFIHLEFSMSFNINYTTNKETIFSLTEFEDTGKKITGDTFIIEKLNISDTSDLIFKMIAKVLGEDILNVSSKTKVYRCI